MNGRRSDGPFVQAFRRPDRSQIVCRTSQQQTQLQLPLHFTARHKLCYGAPRRRPTFPESFHRFCYLLLSGKIMYFMGAYTFRVKEQHTSALGDPMFVFDCSITALFPFPILAIPALSTPSVLLVRVAIEACVRPVMVTWRIHCVVVYACHRLTSF